MKQICAMFVYNNYRCPIISTKHKSVQLQHCNCSEFCSWAIGFLGERQFHAPSSLDACSWMTIRNKFLSGATKISYRLLRTLKKVKSFIGSISRTTDRAFLVRSDIFCAYSFGAVSLLELMVDLRNLPFSS